MTDKPEQVLEAEEPETPELALDMEEAETPGQISEIEHAKTPEPDTEKKKQPWNFIFLMVAGMLAVVAPFIFFIGGGGGTIGVIGLQNFGSEFAYGWAISFLGIMIMIYAVRIHKYKMKMYAVVNFFLGPILIALPFIIANHWLYKFDENELSIPELFFGIGDGWHIYLGGIFAIISGLLAIVFGYRILKEK